MRYFMVCGFFFVFSTNIKAMHEAAVTKWRACYYGKLQCPNLPRSPACPNFTCLDLLRLLEEEFAKQKQIAGEQALTVAENQESLGNS